MAGLAGSLIASLAPVLINKLFGGGKPGQIKAFPTMAPEQMSLLGQTSQNLGQPMQQGLGFLSNILGGDTSKFEAPLMRQFEEQTIPGLAEQFAGMGATNSSAFQQALGGAGAGLMENLGAMRGNLQMQALSPLMQLFQSTMGATPFSYQNIPGQEGAGTALARGMGPAMGKKLPGQISEGMSWLWDLIKGGKE